MGGQIGRSYRETFMALEITQHEANGVCILALKGRLVLGEESTGYRTTVDKLLSSETKRIVIDLEHARYIDSAGLGALLETHRTTKEKGGRLALCRRVARRRPGGAAPWGFQGAGFDFSLISPDQSAAILLLVFRNGSNCSTATPSDDEPVSVRQDSGACNSISPTTSFHSTH